jgi:phosphoribosyl 1,2-cyclic phosphodiesterase
MRYGGNTACVAVEVGDDPPIVFDLGTGLRPFGHDLEACYGVDASIEMTAFLTHLHWDHIIGLPFCTPLLREGGRMDVFGPPQEGGSLHDIIDRVVKPPFFPVQVKELRGTIAFHEVADDVVAVGGAKVRVRRVPHVGTTLGFRIHDAQYTEDEYRAKSTWGHSTVSYSVHVAAEAGSRQLALFHHDPQHTDDDLDRLLADAQRHPDAARLDAVLSAREGLVVDLGRS